MRWEQLVLAERAPRGTSVPVEMNDEREALAERGHIRSRHDQSNI